MKIPPAEAELFSCGRADRYGEANSRFSQICQRALKHTMWAERFLSSPNFNLVADIPARSVVKQNRAVSIHTCRTEDVRRCESNYDFDSCP